MDPQTRDEIAASTQRLRQDIEKLDSARGGDVLLDQTHEQIFQRFFELRLDSKEKLLEEVAKWAVEFQKQYSDFDKNYLSQVSRFQNSFSDCLQSQLLEMSLEIGNWQSITRDALSQLESMSEGFHSIALSVSPMKVEAQEHQNLLETKEQRVGRLKPGEEFERGRLEILEERQKSFLSLLTQMDKRMMESKLRIEKSMQNEFTANEQFNNITREFNTYKNNNETRIQLLEKNNSALEILCKSQQKMTEEIQARISQSNDGKTELQKSNSLLFEIEPKSDSEIETQTQENSHENKNNEEIETQTHESIDLNMQRSKNKIESQTQIHIFEEESENSKSKHKSVSPEVNLCFSSHSILFSIEDQETTNQHTQNHSPQAICSLPNHNSMEEEKNKHKHKICFNEVFSISPHFHNQGRSLSFSFVLSPLFSFSGVRDNKEAISKSFGCLLSVSSPIEVERCAKPPSLSTFSDSFSLSPMSVRNSLNMTGRSVVYDSVPSIRRKLINETTAYFGKSATNTSLYLSRSIGHEASLDVQRSSADEFPPEVKEPRFPNTERTAKGPKRRGGGRAVERHYDPYSVDDEIERLRNTRVVLGKEPPTLSPQEDMSAKFRKMNEEYASMFDEKSWRKKFGIAASLNPPTRGTLIKTTREKRRAPVQTPIRQKGVLIDYTNLNAIRVAPN